MGDKDLQLDGETDDLRARTGAVLHVLPSKKLTSQGIGADKAHAGMDHNQCH